MNSAQSKPLSAVAIVGLNALASYILANPKGYQQNEYLENFATADESGCIAFAHSKLTATERTMKLRVKKHVDLENAGYYAPREHPFFIAAKKDLKLTEDQADRLFGHISRWPKKFIDQYESAKTDKGRARAAYNRILFLIETNGTDEKLPKKLEKTAA